LLTVRHAINATQFLARLQRTQFLTPVLVFVMATLTLAFARR
jgi:hypothetical protein